MKGIVLDALRELVTGAANEATWRTILERAGVEPSTTYGLSDDVDEDLTMRIFSTACDVLGITFAQACDAYGKLWVGSYIPKRYPSFYEGVRSTKDLLVKLDDVHATMRERMPNARPPRHSYTWIDARTLVMGYHSPRGLMDLFVGSVKGLAAYFKETVDVRRLDAERIEIKFPA